MAVSADLKGLLAQFDELQEEIYSLQYAQQVINYDGETVGPAKGVPARAEALGMLALKEHELAFGPRAGELIEALRGHAGELDPLHAAELRVYARDFDETGKIPASECAEMARLTSTANSVWKRAKATNDYALFEPYVTQIVEGLKRQASYLDPSREPYEVWLDRFERGLSCEALDEFFGTVRTSLSPLVEAIVASGNQPDDSFMAPGIPTAQQKAVCDDVARLMGLDMDALAIGDTEHPFTDGFSHGDVRIANHIHEDIPTSALFSLVHEGGHALYEQGIDPAYDYTVLRGGVSMGIHESQSRFMENVIARSEAFCTQLLPILRRHVSGMFDDVDAHMLYRVVSKAEPSLIRTEADELTYPLHVLVRYEVERALFSGQVSAHDAPEMWNALMKRYLGVDVPSDTQGILQDTHWSNGTFAYFPSYAIGSAYAAQFLHAMGRDVDVFGSVERGDLEPVRAWLGTRIWRHGSALDPADIVMGACGEPFDARYYVDYLTQKYRALYEL